MKQLYIGFSKWTKGHPAIAGCLSIINMILSWLVVAAYVALLIYQAVCRDRALAFAIIVPLDGFIVVTAFRYLINRPRPYEAFPLEPAINKKTKGKSFPSRHVYSASAIAMTFLLGSQFQWAGIILLIVAALLAVIRVITNVHYISDVLVGYGCGVACGLIGFIWIPLLMQ